MRVNIYTEELTHDVKVIEKNGFHGLRFFLKSPDDLHHHDADDDRSAITFWGLRTVKPLLERVVQMLQAYADSRGELPQSINERKEPGPQDSLAERSTVFTIFWESLASIGGADGLKKQCPFCHNGILPLTRNAIDGYRIMDTDSCLACGTRVKYADIDEIRASKGEK